MQNTTRREQLLLVRKAIRFMGGREDMGKDAATVAQELGVSEAHLRRIFRRFTGHRLGKHQAGVRLLRAAYELRFSRRSILAIALVAGFATHESFTRAFRSAYGQSPRDYRQASPTHEEKPMNKDIPFAVQFVKIPVSDFDRARRFYRDALGLPESFAVEAYGWAQYETASVPVCIYVAGKGGGEGKPGGETHFHLTHPDIKAVAEKLAEAGFPAGEIQEGDDGSRWTVVHDPDGNSFKLLQAA